MEFNVRSVSIPDAMTAFAGDRRTLAMPVAPLPRRQGETVDSAPMKFGNSKIYRQKGIDR